jgi:hemerythrin-like domain-containing protein/rubredoxin
MLMIEHRLIDRMPKLLAREAERVRSGSVDPERIDAMVDFMRTYADRCHHGKEEDILFLELSRKPMPEDLRSTMEDLVRDHGASRANVRALASANQSYRAGDASARHGMAAALDALSRLYPQHIEKEDRSFFIPCMELFSLEERRSMLVAFQEFDRRMVHDSYRTVMSGLLGEELRSPPQPIAGAAEGRAVCKVCDYAYDPNLGDPERGIPPGTSFGDLPEGWVCPLCGATKDNFAKAWRPR